MTEARTFLIEPFDIMLHATEDGVQSLQARFSTWLRTLNSPARFVCWQMPATLDEKINWLSRAGAGDRRRAAGAAPDGVPPSLRAARRQRRVPARAVRHGGLERPESARPGRGHGFGLRYAGGRRRWPALFEGQYEIRDTPFWHLAPVGRPGGRPLWALLNSYEFAPSTWNFFRPLPPLLRLNFPLALAVDIPKTYERNAAIDALEGIIQAYEVHLSGVRGEDSRSVQRIADCRKALQEINAGDALHLVQISLAIAADDLDTLQERVQAVVNETRPGSCCARKSANCWRAAWASSPHDAPKKSACRTPPGRWSRANWR